MAAHKAVPIKNPRTSLYIASSHAISASTMAADVVARESAGRRVFLHMFFDEGYHSLHVGIVAIGVYLKLAASSQ